MDPLSGNIVELTIENFQHIVLEQSQTKTGYGRFLG